MTVPISIQLYTLREYMKDGGHVEVVRRLSEIGYAALEGGVPKGLEPAEWRRLVEDHGMVISCGGTQVPSTEEEADAAVERLQALGVAHAMCGYGPDRWETEDAIKQVADELNRGYELMDPRGITLCLHNHAWEFQRIDGRLKQDILIELCPAVRFELDVYWATNHGQEDAAAMLARVADRTPMLHLKDGMLEEGEDMLACGSGKQDFAAIMAAADESVLRFGAVELDRCATDMWTAVEESYRYLVGQGLVSGRVAVG